MLKTKNKIKFFATLLVGMLFLWSGVIQAEEKTQDTQKSEALITLATVDILNATYEFDENDQMVVSFDLHNEKGVQSGVRYAIELNPVGKNELIDRKIFAESLTLGENETIHKALQYEAPEFLSGDFEITVRAENDKGLPLGFNWAGEIFLEGTGKGIEVDLDSCLFSVSGESKSRKITEYPILSPQQSVTLQCSAKSALDGEVSVLSRVRTNAYSALGSLVKEQNDDNLVFSKGIKKEFKVVIPRGEVAGAYWTELKLVDNLGKAISNPVDFRFAVLGKGAKILNITADKDVYSKGETAKVDLFWNALGDSGKTFISLDYLLDNGQKCVDGQRKEIGFSQKGGAEKLELPISADCGSGKLRVAILDENNKILDQSELILKGNKSIGNEQDGMLAKAKNQFSGSRTAYVLAFVILIIGILAITFWKKKGRGTMIGLFLFFGLAIWTMGGLEAKAWTSCLQNNLTGRIGVCIADMVQERSCVSKQDLRVESLYQVVDDTSPGVYCLEKLNTYATTYHTEHPRSLLYSSEAGGYKMSRCGFGAQYSIETGRSDFGAGEYSIEFIHFGLTHSFTDASGRKAVNDVVEKTKYFSVYPDDQCGSCGKASGRTYATAPSGKKLCASGVASINPARLSKDKKTWRWNCLGIGDAKGMNQSCRAKVGIPSVNAPAMTISTNLPQVEKGKSITLTWRNTGGPIDSCTGSCNPAGNCADFQSAVEASALSNPEGSGSLVKALNETTFFTVSCEGAGGTSLPAEVGVEVLSCQPVFETPECFNPDPVCSGNCAGEISGSADCIAQDLKCGTTKSLPLSECSGCAAKKVTCPCQDDSWREVNP